MAAPRVEEGYQTTEQALQASGGDVDAWLDSLRDEAQQALVKRLVLERVERGGQDPIPDPHHGSRLSRLAEGILIGVGVTVLSALLCSILGVSKEKAK